MATKSLAPLIFLLSITCTFPSLCQSRNCVCQSQNDTSCSAFDCGNINFSFPFSSSLTFGMGSHDCGLPRYQIACDPSSVARLELSGRPYQVKDLYLSERLITVVDDQLIKDLKAGSCGSLQNLSISINTEIAALSLPPWGINLTFFQCSHGLALSQGFLDGVVMKNYSCSEDYGLYLSRDVRRNESQLNPPRLSPVETPSGCRLVTVPVSSAALSRYELFLNSSSGGGGGDGGILTEIFDVLSDGFPLQWPTLSDCESCSMKGGRCGYDGSSRGIVCFCAGGCGTVKLKHTERRKLIVGVATGSTFVVLVGVLLIFKYKRRTSVIFKASYFKKNQTTGDGRNAEQFIKNYRSTLLTNYSYNDIKKMSNGFKEKLGEGGYGTVYRGKLSDGRTIAVKMLDKSNDINHDFINEVATIGRIHHVNVIRLLGFCWDNSKQALIYEYMPNGSLGDLISREGVSLSLGLARLLEISLGVAHGIEYLHNGCDSRILHLDIKPQNVLLDQNFNPKISDFGLARIYSRNRSAVTMTGARGTIGYIAPEIFLRNLGNPSHKSDVYSYGMLLLEMVGGKKNVEPKTSTSSEAYFPGWIYDKIIEEREMEPIDTVVEEEVCITRKMVMVGLWCIQINPRDRPSMTRVVEMLSGSVEAIEMPPKPFFFSPPRVQFEHDIASIESDTNVLPLTF